MLPYVMRFHREVRSAELGLIAAAMGCEDHSADAAVAEVVRLTAAIGLPPSLQALGVRRDALPALADQALGIERLVRNNPRPLDHDDAVAILEAAWQGDIELVPAQSSGSPKGAAA